uniref:Uncharacterized protein n=1 Tax=Physcomitrium patens TaxID=3218 RepID=A0A2K1KEM2_PHYPA|nr:hypothetical protein PHYPA_008602 [Physcomitrium patens]
MGEYSHFFFALGLKSSIEGAEPQKSYGVIRIFREVDISGLKVVENEIVEDIVDQLERIKSETIVELEEIKKVVENDLPYILVKNSKT